MNKHALKITLGAIIAIVVIGVSAKPLLINYHLYTYSRIPAMSHILVDPDSFDLPDAKNDITDKSDIIAALQRLGYLTSFSIPITTPGADAEELINAISSYTDSHAIPLVVGIDDLSPDASLFVVDKPGTRPFWEAFVRFHIEAKESGRQAAPGPPSQGVGAPER